MYNDYAAYGGLAALGVGMLIFMIIVLAFGVLTYVLQALGMYRMAERRGLPNPWMAWVPFTNMWLLGSIADDANAKTGKNSRWNLILLLLMIGTCIPFLNFLAAIPFMVIYYIALYIIYKEYFNSPGGMLVLSIFVSPAVPFLFFSMGKRDPLDGGYSTQYRGSQQQTFGGYSQQSQPQFPLQSGNIIGVNGMYAGQNFPVNNGEELIFGRDGAFAHIIIDSNATKVSRKHCAIRYDANSRAYSVTDYSSNGTFRDGSTRLIANMPTSIQPGTVISLGDSGNQFRLG